MSIAGFDMKAYEGDLDEDMAEAGNSCSMSLSVALDWRQDDARKIVFLCVWEVLLFCKEHVTAVTPARADLKTDSANGRTANLAWRVAFSPFPRAFALLSEIVVPFLNLLLSMHQTCPLFSRCLFDECECHPRVDFVEVDDSPALFSLSTRASRCTHRVLLRECVEKNGEVMNDVQPPTLNDPVRTRKATIGISVGIGDARSRQPKCWGRGGKKACN